MDFARGLSIDRQCIAHYCQYQEIDYTQEATNAERFAFNFKDMSYVKVPRIYREFSTAQVCICNSSVRLPQQLLLLAGSCIESQMLSYR